MSKLTLDILMITYNRPEYTRLSLPRLLESCDDSMRVWLWHNGDHAETLDIVRSYENHPRLHRFHHSSENVLVREPTNWLFKNADSDLLSVIADDCLVSQGWGQKLRKAHCDEPKFGVLACWHFPIEDFDMQLAEPKIRSFTGGHQVMLNPWVQGSGVVMKRQCVDQLGLLPPKDKGFTSYCMRIAAAGWVNGWYLPLIPIDHMDDPRSVNTMLRSDADLAEHLPLSAQFRGVRSIDEWTAHLRKTARALHTSPADPRQYFGLRKKIRRIITRLKRQELLY